VYDFDIQSLNTQVHMYYNYKISILNIDFNLIEVISFILLSAAFIKSAQFGAHI
jgi:NADH:ubiquinone oxidoreductase subunit 5 (subunit L)/multisubunit Na+/H+ antiporter MnhA subunit